MRASTRENDLSCLHVCGEHVTVTRSAFCYVVMRPPWCRIKCCSNPAVRQSVSPSLCLSVRPPRDSDFLEIEKS